MSSLPVPLPRPAWRFPGLPGRAIAAYVVVYLMLDWISFIHPMIGLNITPWSPQSAIAVGLLVWSPGAWWLVWLTTCIAEGLATSAPVPWGAALLSSAALAAGYALTALALTHCLGRRPQVTTRRDFMALMLVVVTGALAISLLHVFALSVLGIAQPGRVLTAIGRGWIGEAVGLMVTLPILLVLASRERRAASNAMLRSGEWWSIMAVSAAGVAAVFAQSTDEQFKFFYLLFLPVVWAAARFGVVGAVWSAALVQGLLIAAVQSANYRPLTVFEFQLLVAALAAMGLLLGTTVDEREDAASSLRASLRLAAAGDMAAALAHELNQPLAALSAYARSSHLLARRLGEKDAETARPFIEVSGRLASEASRAGEVVNRLRNFFRDRSTELQPTDMETLLDEALRAQAARARAQHIRLDHHCDPGLGPLWLDPVQIAVVLRNLVANAVDAASQAQRPGEEASVTVRAVRDDDVVTVAVLDSGPGIPGSEAQAVFENRRSEKAGGMGIGLGISRSIIEAHGGRMWADIGPGGKFYFSLPVGLPNACE